VSTGKDTTTSRTSSPLIWLFHREHESSTTIEAQVNYLTVDRMQHLRNLSPVSQLAGTQYSPTLYWSRSPLWLQYKVASK